MLSDLYQRCWAEHGLAADVVDRQTIWKLAAMLGADDVDRTPPDDDESPVPSPRGGDDLIEQRLAHARGEGPAPEAAPTRMSPLLAAGMIRADSPG